MSRFQWDQREKEASSFKFTCRRSRQDFLNLCTASLFCCFHKGLLHNALKEPLTKTTSVLGELLRLDRFLKTPTRIQTKKKSSWIKTPSLDLFLSFADFEENVAFKYTKEPQMSLNFRRFKKAALLGLLQTNCNRYNFQFSSKKNGLSRLSGWSVTKTLTKNYAANEAKWHTEVMSLRSFRSNFCLKNT